MINGCKKIEDCWTNIGSPDFVLKQQLRGYLENRTHGLLNLTGREKNGLRFMRYNTLELLRQEDASDPGFILRGHKNLSGGGSPKGLMSCCHFA